MASAVLPTKTWSVDPNSPATRGKVEQGYIDAAASAPSLDAPQVAIARDIAARRLDGAAPEPISAARLSWVLLKTKDPELQARFKPLAETLGKNEAKINGELIGAQGKPVDMGGYYLPDSAKTSAAMRPSATLNAALAAL